MGGGGFVGRVVGRVVGGAVGCVEGGTGSLGGVDGAVGVGGSGGGTGSAPPTDRLAPTFVPTAATVPLGVIACGSVVVVIVVVVVVIVVVVIVVVVIVVGPTTELGIGVVLVRSRSSWLRQNARPPSPPTTRTTAAATAPQDADVTPRAGASTGPGTTGRTPPGASCVASTATMASTSVARPTSSAVLAGCRNDASSAKHSAES